MKLETKSHSDYAGAWMEIKFVLEPEEFNFLRKEAEQKSEMVSDLVRRIVLKYIGNERSKA